MAKLKPVLVEVDGARWERAKAKAPTLGMTVSQFTDYGLQMALGEVTHADTKAMAEDALQRVAEVIHSVADYAASPTTALNCFTATQTTGTLQATPHHVLRAEKLGSTTLGKKRSKK